MARSNQDSTWHATWKSNHLFGIFHASACFFFYFVVFACVKVDPNETPLFFELPSSHTQITFYNTLEENDKLNIIEYLYFYNGGGVAIGDINNDGLPDIYFSSNQGENKLYLNKGNMVFEDISETAGVTSQGSWKTGVTMVDINGDGLLDIYLCRVSGYKGLTGKNELYINQGDLSFKEEAAEYGLDFQGFSTQAAFFDFDKDGDLDMYLLNHAVHTERSYGTSSLRYRDHPTSGDRLYRNNLNEGEKRFRSVTSDAGIYSSHIGYGLGVGIADFDQDGWPDIYVSNDFNENDYIYLNNKDGTFREVSKVALGHSSRFSMGNDLADFNNDGWVDILTLDMHPPNEAVLKRSAGEDAYEIHDLKLRFGFGRQVAQNALHLNSGTGTFSEIAQLAGIYATDWSWAGLFADFDLDGQKDIFISNGIKRRPNDMDYINFIMDEDRSDGLKKNPDLADKVLIDQMPEGDVTNFFFKNNGNLTFLDVSAEWGMNLPGISNGVAYADLDNDGDLDLVVNHLNGKAGVFKNLIKERAEDVSAYYLQVQFEGEGFNRFGLGAVIWAFGGGRLVYHENYSTRGFQSSVPPRITMGLGTVEQLDSMVVRWPSGKIQRLYQVLANQRLTVKESLAKHVDWKWRKSQEESFFQPVSEKLGICFEHFEDEFNDFNEEYLLPHKLSREGPRPATWVNEEGDTEWLFFPGPADQSGKLYRADAASKKFIEIQVEAIATDSVFEDVNAIFFDSNNNSLPDLYVMAGGNRKAQVVGPAYDRLYLNQGNGKFIAASATMPQVDLQSSVALAADWDGDGRLDLFIGGRTVPGSYGQSPQSVLLRNRGDGFEPWTKQAGLEDGKVGMVTDALAVDVNRDGWQDLVLVGEWMPPSIWINEGGKFSDQTAAYGLDNLRGWWYRVRAEDLNGDGYPDLVVGNLGLNSKLKSPAYLYLADFDNNGKTDPILAYEKQGRKFPIGTRDELVRQIPSLKKDFGTHGSFAGKTISQIFSKNDLTKADEMQVDTFESMVLMNVNGQQFIPSPLPVEAQVSPVFGLEFLDLNGDGHLDLILGGNFLHAAPYFGPYDAGKGCILIGDGMGGFQPVSSEFSNWSVYGEIRDISLISAFAKQWLIVSRNDDTVSVFQVKVP